MHFLPFQYFELFNHTGPKVRQIVFDYLLSNDRINNWETILTLANHSLQEQIEKYELGARSIVIVDSFAILYLGIIAIEEQHHIAWCNLKGSVVSNRFPPVNVEKDIDLDVALILDLEDFINGIPEEFKDLDCTAPKMVYQGIRDT